MDLLRAITNLPSLQILGGILGLFIAHFAVYQAYRIFIYPHYFSPLRHLPGPKDHHFLLGQSLNQFRSGSPNEPFVSWMRKWPTASMIRYFTAGNSEALLVTSLEAHNEILYTKCYSFEKPAFFIRLIRDIAGLGLPVAIGDTHRKQRKTLNGLFSLSNLKAYIPVFRSKAGDLCNAYDKAIRENDGVVELVTSYSRIMLDVIGVFTLGIEMDFLKSKSSYSFHDCYHEMFDPDPMGQILVAINGFIPIRWLPIEANRRYLRASSIVRDQIREIIYQRIEEVGERRKKGQGSQVPEGHTKDLLTFMVEEKYFANEDKWDVHDIMNQILTFLAAGHETTASSLVWTTHVLSQRQDIAKRLRDEILPLLERSPEPNYSELEALPYLKNFTRELLRVHCPAIHAPREAVEDVVIQGVHIPKGTTVVMYPAVIQHNPVIWGEDCDEFNPDRWDKLEGPSADAYAFAAFMQGPRMCIGRVMTLIEFKVILVEIIRRFDFEHIPQKIELVNPSPLLRPKGGLKVKVKRVG